MWLATDTFLNLSNATDTFGYPCSAKTWIYLAWTPCISRFVLCRKWLISFLIVGPESPTNLHYPLQRAVEINGKVAKVVTSQPCRYVKYITDTKTNQLNFAFSTSLD